MPLENRSPCGYWIWLVGEFGCLALGCALPRIRLRFWSVCTQKHTLAPFVRSCKCVFACHTNTHLPEHTCVCRKHPIHTTTDDDVVGLRQKIMKMPWIKTAEVFFLKDRQRVRGKSKNVRAKGSYLINTSLNPAMRQF